MSGRLLKLSSMNIKASLTKNSNEFLSIVWVIITHEICLSTSHKHGSRADGKRTQEIEISLLSSLESYTQAFTEPSIFRQGIDSRFFERINLARNSLPDLILKNIHPCPQPILPYFDFKEFTNGEERATLLYIKE